MPKATRSPAAPSHSAEYCLATVDTLYQRYAHNSFASSDIATALNVSSTSGAFRGLLSDLKQYGLLEKTGRSNFRVGQIVKDYQVVANDSPESQKPYRYKIAITPPFFNNLIQSCQNKIPAPSNLATLLMSQHGFNRA